MDNGAKDPSFSLVLSSQRYLAINVAMWCTCYVWQATNIELSKRRIQLYEDAIPMPMQTSSCVVLCMTGYKCGLEVLISNNMKM